jgi:hypothetical protein
VIPFSDGGLQVFPFQKVHRRLTDGAEAQNLTAYYDGIRQKLAG